MDVAVGIDSHKSSLAVAGIDALGGVIASKEFPNDGRGHAAVLAWVRSKGASRVIYAAGDGDDPDKALYLGPDQAGRFLEVVVVVRADGTELAIHAMKMRP